MFAALLLSVVMTQSPPPLVLAIGVNGAVGSAQPPLSFADDDAASAAELFGSTESSWLLTTMDAETQERFPSLRSIARPPTLAELHRAVADMARVLDGRPRDVIIWLVGHGAFTDSGAFFIALEDGPLTQQVLEQSVIAPLAAAHRIHVLVDACHAEALVKARASLAPAEVSLVEKQQFVQHRIQHGHVGFVAAAAAHEKTWEWSGMRSGVFSALVRSGLRGAANADGDNCVTYAELDAYVASSLRGIAIPSVRPRVTSIPPRVDAGAPIACRTHFSSPRVLSADLSSLGAIAIEDGRGVWLAGGRFEHLHTTTLWLPGEGRLSLLAAPGEHALTSTDGKTLQLSDAPIPPATRPRGAMEDAIREGLFAVAYGPSFLQGYEAARTLNTPVSIESEPSSSRPLLPRLHVPAILGAPLVVTGAVALGAALVGAAFAGWFFWTFRTTSMQREAEEARINALYTGIAAAGAGVAAAILLGAGAAALLVDLVISLRS